MITTFHNTRLAPPFMLVKNRNEDSARSKTTVRGNAPSRNYASSNRLRTDANPSRRLAAVAW
jgi:hypothetical protein